jgi:hypothetical protein
LGLKEILYINILDQRNETVTFFTIHTEAAYNTSVPKKAFFRKLNSKKAFILERR